MSQAIYMVTRIADRKLKYRLVDTLQITVNDNTFGINHAIDFHYFDLELEGWKWFLAYIGFFEFGWVVEY